jgi:hypothetical protein
MVHPGSLQELPPDPHGFDSEGLVRLSTGQFWVAEEYGPSLAEVSPEGCVLRRLVPRGTTLAGADCAVEDVLPAEYARRCDNRGLESLAVAPDQSRLFCLLQSPLEPAGMAPGEEPHSVRLLVLDPVAGRPVAEYLYPLGERADPVADTVAADGKISALAAIDSTTLLVLERPSKANKLYPYLTKANIAKAAEYQKMLPQNVHSIGRLGTYKYSTIEQTIIQAFACVSKITGKPNEMEGEWRGIGDTSMMKDRKESN